MNRRLCFLAVLLMMLPLVSSTPVSAAKAFAEGITFSVSTHPNASAATYLSLTATKRADGSWRQTSIEFWQMNCCGRGGFIGRGILNGDPDGLEVSRDLGWGGLDGQVTLVDINTGEQRLYEFHLQSNASQRDYTEDPATWYFDRPSVVTGVIMRDGAVVWTFPLTSPAYHEVTGVNFSDQWPGY